MNIDQTATDQTRLRCISTILELDEEALQIVDTLLTRVAVSEKIPERKPRAKQAKPTATPATNEVAR